MLEEEGDEALETSFGSKMMFTEVIQLPNFGWFSE